MADKFSELDSEGVYSGMSLADFGVRVSKKGDGIMPRDQLRESIQHLRDELSAGGRLSSEDRSQLENVLGEVSEILDSSADTTAPESSVFSDLPGLVERIESTHPKLAVILGRIADSLSQLGI